MATEPKSSVLGNSSSDSSGYAQLDLRQAITGNLDDGIALRFGVGRATYTYTGGSGVNTAVRLSGAYNMTAGPGSLTVALGVANVEVTNTPAAATDFNKSGAFAMLEYDGDFANGDSIVGLVEYTDASEGTFVGGHYLFNTGGNIKLGPAFNAVREPTYERDMVGLRATYFLGSGADLTATLTRGNQTSVGTKSNLTTFELQLRSEF